MEPKKIRLWKTGPESSLTLYLLDGEKVRPCILVIPGGAYACVCESTEGSPIAKAFNKLGFHAAVLDYRVAPNRFPAPQQDAMRAMRLLRGNAQAWKIQPDEIAACGFSAGGHLAASLGTKITDSVCADAGDAFDKFSYVPDALIIGYGVLTFKPFGHLGTAEFLLGKVSAAERMKYSPDACVTAKTPPAFLWHTIRDQAVDYRSSVSFAKAMADHGRPCELHLFPNGDHGMLLGLETPDVSIWPVLAKRFMKARKKSATFNKKHYTNAFQAAAEQKN